MNNLGERQFDKELGRMGRLSPPNEVFNRVWFKVEDRLANRKKHFWNSIVWRPWAHPVGWVALSACLGVALTGVSYERNQADNNEMASYLLTISNPADYLAHDDNVVNVSKLLTEPSPVITAILSSDEEQVNVLPGDEIFL